jgi:hypothetical protein
MTHGKHHENGATSERELAHLQGSALASEGLDDELLRQLGRLLAEEAATPGTPARPRTPSARKVREHLLVAGTALAAGLLDRAEAEAEAALSLGRDEQALSLLAAVHHRRGALSASIALWHEIMARTGEEPSALRHLGRLFETSMRDAEARMRSPAAPAAPEGQAQPGLPDLEQAFRLAFGGHLPAALRLVDRVAARARTADRYLFKLAMLERAFLQEQAEDVRGAITTLERLADEQGLASDVERLLCLSMLYEREGTPERIRRALRAVRYAYLSTRRPTLLRRIARLLAKLGHTRLAEMFEARYLEIFRRRMHEFGVRETARALCLAYVPPERLATLAGPRRWILSLAERHARRQRPLHRRRAAVLLLWAGEVERAAALLSAMEREGQATAVDLLYLADAEEQRGASEEAQAIRRRAVAAHGRPDAAVLAAWLGREEPEDVAAALGSPERLAEAAAALRAHLKAHPTNVAAVRALGRVERARGRSHAAAEREAQAGALLRMRDEPRPFVLAAAAMRRGGEVRGLLHEVWVESRRSSEGPGFSAEDVLGAVAPDLRARAVSIFYAVRTFAKIRYPHRMAPDADARRYILRVTKDDEPSSGDSAGVPLAMAFLSALLGLSIPEDVAFTGAVVCDAHDMIVLARVGDVEAKIEGAYERRMRRIVLPAGNREDVLMAERVPRRVAEQMVLFGRTLDEVVAAVFPELA